MLATSNMGREDWYRNKVWNSDVECAFFTKLKRARDKRQYLRIQACTLADTKPEVALRLLDEYFLLPAGHDQSQAHVDRAASYLALGNLEKAISAYESALARETEFPKSLTQAYIDLPHLIVSRELTEYYDRAKELLDSHAQWLMFPVDYFKWNACQALLAKAKGQASEVLHYASAALDAAKRTSPGFQYNPTIGLVSHEHSELLSRLGALSRG
jgi:tetratricopeptide (TPR) repeat protein